MRKRRREENVERDFEKETDFPPPLLLLHLHFHLHLLLLLDALSSYLDRDERVVQRRELNDEFRALFHFVELPGVIVIP